MQVLAEIGIIPPDVIALLTPELQDKLLAITTTEVDEMERKVTKHDIRAWVRIAQNMMPEPLRRWVHVPLTSYDALDTGRAMLFALAHQKVVQPKADCLITLLADRVEEYGSQIQIGRTHRKHALPITAGFWLATIESRFIYNANQANIHADGLVGKISGAVGAYNAQVGLGITERCSCGRLTFEELVLEKVGLKPARISTQILPPEPLAYYLFACTMFSGAIGQFGRDGRALMSTEIGEVSEPFEVGQVGSSTMAHKRNPINFENSEGQFLKNKNEFGKVFDTVISDNQRDLVGSCVARDFPTIVVNLVQQFDTLLRKGPDDKTFIQRFALDSKACERNFAMESDRILAEPMYLALQMAGYSGDAHSLINERIVPLLKDGKNIVDVFLEVVGQSMDLDAREAWNRLPEATRVLLSDPKKYTGAATQKCAEVVKLAREFVTSY